MKQCNIFLKRPKNKTSSALPCSGSEMLLLSRTKIKRKSQKLNNNASVWKNVKRNMNKHEKKKPNTQTLTLP